MDKEKKNTIVLKIYIDLCVTVSRHYKKNIYYNLRTYELNFMSEFVYYMYLLLFICTKKATQRMKMQGIQNEIAYSKSRHWFRSCNCQ